MNWNDWIVSHEMPIRLGFFLSILVTMAIWEWRAPCRTLTVSKAVRWANNLGLTFGNSLLLRWLFPAAAVGVATLAQQHGWGLLPLYEIPFLPAIFIAVIAMDFVIYLQHVMVHAIPLFWRLHRVHHADLDFDVTTGARFHPLEIILSMLIKFATIMILGPPVIAVILFEILLNATALFNHANVQLPTKLDQILRWFVVTPDMHRVHHSVEDFEANSNFGFNLPWWDRLFGTYREQPQDGHQGMTIGIHQYRNPKQVNQLPGMLMLPFVGKISRYAIHRRSNQKP